MPMWDRDKVNFIAASCSVILLLFGLGCVDDCIELDFAS